MASLPNADSTKERIEAKIRRLKAAIAAAEGDTTTPDKRAMANLCQALISANRFLYID